MQAFADWLEQSEKLFVKTRAYHECKEILKDSHWVTILGIAGDGKTTMAARLMSEYREKGFEPVFITSTQDWKRFVVCEENKKQIVVIDDMFGSTCVDKLKLNKWLSNLEMMTKIVSKGNGNIVIICTSRKHIFEDVKSLVFKFRPFADSMLLDLTNRRWKLNGEEKYDIFVKYANEYNLETFSLREIENLDPPIGFPYCVSVYCTNIYLRQKGIMFFKNPINCIQQEICSFQEWDRVKYLLLILVLLNKNKLQSYELETLCLYNPTPQYQNILKAVGVPIDKSYPDIIKSLNSLSGSYLLQGSNDSFSFTHDCLLENLATVFIKSNPVLAIQLLPLNYLISVPMETKSDEVLIDDYTNCLQKSHRFLPVSIRKPLVERLTREIKQGNVFYSCSCNAWSDSNFVQEWINCVTNDNEELVKILCTCATVCDNVIISLTELDMENAVIAILNNNKIRHVLKRYPEGHDVLQCGLEISCTQKHNVWLAEAFSSAPLEAFKLQGSELFLRALSHSDGECAKILLENTEIDLRQGDFKAEYFRYYESVKKIKTLLACQLAELLIDLGVDMKPSDLGIESHFRISATKIWLKQCLEKIGLEQGLLEQGKIRLDQGQLEQVKVWLKQEQEQLEQEKEKLNQEHIQLEQPGVLLKQEQVLVKLLSLEQEWLKQEQVGMEQDQMQKEILQLKTEQLLLEQEQIRQGQGRQKQDKVYLEQERVQLSLKQLLKPEKDKLGQEKRNLKQEKGTLEWHQYWLEQQEENQKLKHVLLEQEKVWIDRRVVLLKQRVLQLEPQHVGSEQIRPKQEQILLKQEQVWLEQEQVRLEQEKARIKQKQAGLGQKLVWLDQKQVQLEKETVKLKQEQVWQKQKNELPEEEEKEQQQLKQRLLEQEQEQAWLEQKLEIVRMELRRLQAPNQVLLEIRKPNIICLKRNQVLLKKENLRLKKETIRMILDQKRLQQSQVQERLEQEKVRLKQEGLEQKQVGQKQDNICLEQEQERQEQELVELEQELVQLNQEIVQHRMMTIRNLLLEEKLLLLAKKRVQRRLEQENVQLKQVELGQNEELLELKQIWQKQDIICQEQKPVELEQELVCLEIKQENLELKNVQLEQQQVWLKQETAWLKQEQERLEQVQVWLKQEVRQDQEK